MAAGLAASAVVLVASLPAPAAHGVTHPVRRRSVGSVSAAPSPSSSPPATVWRLPQPAPTTFVVLQMNLCDSGWARSCYASGRSVAEAVAKIHLYAPDLVTVQEVCHDTVYSAAGLGPLAQAMADLYGADHLLVDFVAAADRRTDAGLRCVDGQFYGVALISHVAAGGDTHYGWYHSQDATPEMRAWTCATLVVGQLTGCTTHLSTNRTVAMRQCHELMSTLDSPWVLPEVVVAGDFNLTANRGGAHDVRGCVPSGYHRVSDGSLQQVVFSGSVRWVRGGYARMRWTDHPVLYETFRVPPAG